MGDQIELKRSYAEQLGRARQIGIRFLRHRSTLHRLAGLHRGNRGGQLAHDIGEHLAPRKCLLLVVDQLLAGSRQFVFRLPNVAGDGALQSERISS